MTHIKKIYKCCICHKEIGKHPVRLCEFIHKDFAYRQRNKYDFCEECFKRFRGWVKKHEERSDSDE